MKNARIEATVNTQNQPITVPKTSVTNIQLKVDAMDAFDYSKP